MAGRHGGYPEFSLALTPRKRGAGVGDIGVEWHCGGERVCDVRRKARRGYTAEYPPWNPYDQPFPAAYHQQHLPPAATPPPAPPHPRSHPRITLAGSLDPATGIFYRTPEHPRLRTAQACEKCRTRKAKCSGEHPACARCLARGLVYEYAREGRVRGPNKPKGCAHSSSHSSTHSTAPNAPNADPPVKRRRRNTTLAAGSPVKLEPLSSCPADDAPSYTDPHDDGAPTVQGGQPDTHSAANAQGDAQVHFDAHGTNFDAHSVDANTSISTNTNARPASDDGSSTSTGTGSSGGTTSDGESLVPRANTVHTSRARRRARVRARVFVGPVPFPLYGAAKVGRPPSPEYASPGFALGRAEYDLGAPGDLGDDDLGNARCKHESEDLTIIAPRAHIDDLGGVRCKHEDGADLITHDADRTPQGKHKTASRIRMGEALFPCISSNVPRLVHLFASWNGFVVDDEAEEGSASNNSDADEEVDEWVRAEHKGRGKRPAQPLRRLFKKPRHVSSDDVTVSSPSILPLSLINDMEPLSRRSFTTLQL
ncbi:hypothetical protein C8J57DRAFT_1719095 [Mycena rebaudengoi]|nr:hypothetical protein C8J57DRAFT_1719095 [Mycena rebaudengoi]